MGKLNHITQLQLIDCQQLNLTLVRIYQKQKLILNYEKYANIDAFFSFSISFPEF